MSRVDHETTVLEGIPKASGPSGVMNRRIGAGALFGRAYAAGYDWVEQRLDLRGARDHRRRLVGFATGDVLEVGVGTGRNIPLYRSAARVVALEPDPAMLARAEHAGSTAKVPVGVVQGDSMHLPFPDHSFDTVVSSLVLCTIADPRRALAEVRRVLRPGGTLRFYEHVRAAEPRLARWQDRLRRPWGWIARGCHPNREIVAVIEDAGFRLLEVEAFDFSSAPSIVRPHVIGVAACQ